MSTQKVIDLNDVYATGVALSGGPAKVGPAQNWFPPFRGAWQLPLPYPPQSPAETSR